MDNFYDLKKLFLHPKEFFNSVIDDEDYLKPLLIFASAYVLYYIISEFLIIIRDTILNPAMGLSSLVGAVIGLMVVIIPLALVIPFIAAGLIHLGTMILGVRGNFIQTFKVASYGGLIALAYGLVAQIFAFPASFILEDTATFNFTFLAFLILVFIISIAGMIHLLYAEIQGLSLYLNTSKTRAFISIILLPLILVIIVGILLAYFIGLMVGFSQTGQMVANLPNIPR